MHQHVQAQGFLLAHGELDFGLHAVLVVGRVQRAALERGAGGADCRGLRKRANGGGGQQRQLEPCALGLLALQERAVALVGAWCGCSQPGRHGGAVHARAGAAGRLGSAGLAQRALHQVLSLADGGGQ